MPRYNIAAVPQGQPINQDFFDLAHSYKADAAGYWLDSKNALPHATLCQFDADNDDAAKQATKNFIKHRIIVKTEGVYVLPDPSDQNFQLFWIGFSVVRDSELIKLHSEVYNKLSLAELKIHGRNGIQYFPHFTITRSSRTVDIVERLVRSELSRFSISCEIKLGISDINGQLTSVFT